MLSPIKVWGKSVRVRKLWSDIYDRIYMKGYIWSDIYDWIYMKGYIWSDIYEGILRKITNLLVHVSVHSGDGEIPFSHLSGQPVYLPSCVTEDNSLNKTVLFSCLKYFFMFIQYVLVTDINWDRDKNQFFKKKSFFWQPSNFYR